MKPLKIALKIIGIVLGIILLLAAAGIAFLSVREYKPKPTEPLSFDTGSTSPKQLHTGQTLTALSWNIGYCALDKDQDFFMDGGEHSRPSDPETLADTMSGIADILARENADFLLIQEIDKNSDRSYHIDEYSQITQSLAYAQSAYANNFLCDYVPYPIPGMLGKIDSGIATLTRYEPTSAERISLPVPFKWPVRIANLKRCLLVERIPIADSDKELVLINLHLEAYDDGEGKIAQTKQLMELLTDEYAKGNYCIAAGDFNQTFPGVDEQIYAIRDENYWTPSKLDTSALSTDWAVAFDDGTATCRLLNMPYDPDNSATQLYVIDGFILSPNVTLHEIKTLDEGFTYADHNPVRATITLNP